MADLVDPLVSVDWLAANLSRKDVKVLDGTWVMPGDETGLPGGYIPDAQFFDLDKIADKSSELKHMLPQASVFEVAVSSMGIENNDHVIVYDAHGVFSSPRLWWTFRMFGHDRVSVLDGGLPAWIKAAHDIIETPSPVKHKSQYKARTALGKVSSQGDVLKSLSADTQTLDARPSGRFNGTSPEPRASLRSGHIPGGLSLPFGSLRTPDSYFKSLDELADLVSQSGVDLDRPIITTCGSGITAAGLAFTLHRLGATDVSVYDGSWAEWGASDMPLEAGKHDG